MARKNSLKAHEQRTRALMAAPMAAAASITITPLSGKHMTSRSAAMSGWRMTAPISAEVHAATQNTASAPLIWAKP